MGFVPIHPLRGEIDHRVSHQEIDWNFNMMFSPSIGWKQLGQFCRNLSIGLNAGLDMRRVLKQQSETGRPYFRQQLGKLASAVNRGESLTDAIRETDAYFPRFMHEMVRVGEQTGRLDRVLAKLAEYYEHLSSLRRMFLAGIAWPLIQLAMAIGVIGVLILALGWVADITGQETDILGFGLVGTRGLIRYLIFIGSLIVIALILIRLSTREPVAGTINGVLLRVPGLRITVQTMALARFAYALGLGIDAGADARKSMQLAFSSTSNEYYRRHTTEVDRAIRRGEDFQSALEATGAFPDDFLAQVQVGEESGQLAESMLHAADLYQDQAKHSMQGVTLFATFMVWGGVAAILIGLIFRIFGFYAKTLDPANFGI